MHEYLVEFTKTCIVNGALHRDGERKYVWKELADMLLDEYKAFLISSPNNKPKPVVKIHGNPVPALMEALREASCWIPDGTRRSAQERGAKCETITDAVALMQAAQKKAELWI